MHLVNHIITNKIITIGTRFSVPELNTYSSTVVGESDNDTDDIKIHPREYKNNNIVIPAPPPEIAV